MPWLLLVMTTAMALVVVAARLGTVVNDSAQARTAADAAALAGAVNGAHAADELARANGGELVSFRRTVDGVEVVVRFGDVLARAEATAVVSWHHVLESD